MIRSMLTLCVVPAADTTFSSIIVLPKSLQPYESDCLPTSGPIVTHDDWKFCTLSSINLPIAKVFRYSSAVTFSAFIFVFSDWNVHGMNARNPGLFQPL